MKRITSVTLASLLGMMSLGFMLMGGVAHDGHHSASAASEPCPVEAMLRAVCAADGASASLAGASSVSAPAKAAPTQSAGLLGQVTSTAVPALALLSAGMAARRRPRERSLSLERHVSWLSLFSNSPSMA